MSFDSIQCPDCGAIIKSYRNPIPTVDVIIEIGNGIVLIERRNNPKGFALPGGFVDYGETLEAAAAREALEETGIRITGITLLGCYSDPARDKRHHTISTVFVAHGEGQPVGNDDALRADVYAIENLPDKLCFDHARIISDYLSLKAENRI